MHLVGLGSPAQLWRRWVLLAAGHAALGRPGCEIQRHDGCGHLEDDAGRWLRMRRLAGNRAILWGHDPDDAVSAGLEADLLDSAPDWAYDADRAQSDSAWREVGHLAWHAHGSWSSTPDQLSAGTEALLSTVGTDEALHSWWRATWPDASDDQLAVVLRKPEATALAAVVGGAAASRAARQVGLGRSWAGHQLSDTAASHLRAQIYAQMRSADELVDRGHPKRPTLLRQWARVNLAGTPFRHAICAVGAGSAPLLVGSVDNDGLRKEGKRSLENVLNELRMLETDEQSGAWLFVKVSCDGRSVAMDRRYDGWPGWYLAPAAGPSLAGLHLEMAQRAPDWRPPWSTLLP
ncbi:MAG: hypothetical protein ACR2FG_05960 [Marmoricola sp.]